MLDMARASRAEDCREAANIQATVGPTMATAKAS